VVADTRRPSGGQTNNDLRAAIHAAQKQIKYLKGAGLGRPLKQPRRQIQLPPKTIINNQIIVKVKARGCGRSLRSLPYPLTFHIGVHIQKTDTL
jgi:hypothetical protein